MIRNLMIGAGVAALAAAAWAADLAPAPMGDHELTRAEALAKVRDHFAKMDTNKDGTVTTDEIDAMMEHHMAMHDGGPGEKHWEGKMGDPNAAFDRLDTNKDGSISRDEFAKGREVRIEKRIIMSGDGKEMTGDAQHHDMKMMHGGGGMGGHMMIMADGNHDGTITLAEAEALVARHFDEMDANHDGKVTRDERKAAKPMMIRMHKEEHAPKAG